jgi:hypothetical protein
MIRIVNFIYIMIIFFYIYLVTTNVDGESFLFLTNFLNYFVLDIFFFVHITYKYFVDNKYDIKITNQRVRIHKSSRNNLNQCQHHYHNIDYFYGPFGWKEGKKVEGKKIAKINE